MEDTVATIEERLALLEAQVRTEARARAHQDLDQSQLELRLRSMDNLLQALALTSSDQTRLLTALQNQSLRAEDRLEAFQADVQAGFAMLASLIDPENESGPDT
jgi:hypothetical protein